MSPLAGPGRRGSVLHVLAPGPAGGLETAVRTLAVAQVAHGRQVLVAAIVDSARHPFLRSLTGSGIPVTPLVVSQRAYIQLWLRLHALFKAAAPDVVHTHGYLADILAGSAARKAGAPVVATAHGFTGMGWRIRLYEVLQRRAFLRASAVIAVAGSLQDRLQRAGVDTRGLWLVRNAFGPIASPLGRTAARQRLGLGEDTLTIGWVGRLSIEKGPDVFLRALPHIRLGLPWVAVIIGDGPQRAQLENWARAYCPGAVRFAGLVDDAACLLPGCDVLALSSRTEGTPMVLLEAMAANVPIVATRVGGVPDMLGETEALLCPPEDPPALAAALGSALSDPAAARIRATRAQARLERDFSIPAWVAAHEAVYAAVRPILPTSTPDQQRRTDHP